MSYCRTNVLGKTRVVFIIFLNLCRIDLEVGAIRVYETKNKDLLKSIQWHATLCSDDATVRAVARGLLPKPRSQTPRSTTLRHQHSLTNNADISNIDNSISNGGVMRLAVLPEDDELLELDFYNADSNPTPSIDHTEPPTPRTRGFAASSVALATPIGFSGQQSPRTAMKNGEFNGKALGELIRIITLAMTI